MKSNLLLVAQIGFILLTLIFAGLLLQQLKKGINSCSWHAAKKKKVFTRILILLFLWMSFVTFWSASGMMGDFSVFPFNFMPVLAIPLIVVVITLFTKPLGEILQNIPKENIIRLQSFRFFVELLLWALFAASVAPIQMTFEGRNFDILSGISAPLIAWLVARQKLPRIGIIIWNLLCLGLLINIVSVAILSTPTSIRVFMNEPANTIVTHFPVSWLPGFLVPLAYTLHFFSMKQVLAKKESQVLDLKNV